MEASIKNLSFEYKYTDILFDAIRELFKDENFVHQGPDGVMYGAIYAGFVSEIIGMRFPGPGSIIVSSHYDFFAPAKLNDVIVGTIVDSKIKLGGRIVKTTILFINKKSRKRLCRVRCLVDVSLTSS